MVTIEELKLGNRTLEALKFLLEQITELETVVGQIDISEIKDANTLTKEQIATLQDVKSVVEAISSDLNLKKSDFDEKKQNFDINMSAFINDKADFDEKKADFDSKNNTALSNFAFISSNVEKINSTSALLAEATTILETIKPMEQRTQEALDAIANSQAKFDELGALKTSLLELKKSLENITTTGLITDTKVSTIQTYSSKKIEDLVNNAKTTLTADINNQKQSIITLDGKINSTQNSFNNLASSVSNALSQKIDKNDAYTKQESDRKFLKIGDYGLGEIDNMPILQNIDDMTTSTGFYRAVENQTSGTFPKPYGGSKHAHVIVERVDANWIKQTIVQISQDGTKQIFYRTNNRDRGWHPWKEVVTADGYNLDILKEATSNSSSNTLVKRDVNGDFVGRWITADHFLMRTEAQDKNLDANSEICFRNAQASKNSPSHMRFATLAKFKEALGLSRGSVGASGWVGLPTGLILQWGQIQNLGVGEKKDVLYPIVFPNWTLSVVATPGLPSPNNGISSLHINGFFKEKFTIQNTDTNSVYPAYWIAIGY